MDSAKSHKQALAIAYNVKKQAMKKAKGGMINEKLHPQDEDESSKDMAKKIAQAVMAKEKMMCAGGEMYADGGEVEEDELSESGDDLLAPDANEGIHAMASGGMMDEMANLKEDDEPAEDDKAMLARVMAKVRMKHMGKRG